MERFISVEIFREKGISCRRNDTNFLYHLVHLCGSNSLFWCGKKNTGTIAVFVRKFSPKGKFHEICPIPTRSVVLNISS